MAQGEICGSEGGGRASHKFTLSYHRIATIPSETTIGDPIVRGERNSARVQRRTTMHLVLSLSFLLFFFIFIGNLLMPQKILCLPTNNKQTYTVIFKIFRYTITSRCYLKFIGNSKYYIERRLTQ